MVFMLGRGVSVDRWIDELGETAPLFAVRMGNLCSTPPIGQDIAFAGYAEDKRFYYCKDDDGHRIVKASEHVFTCLADHLNIAVARHTAVQVSNNILFGSMQPENLVNPTSTREIFNSRAFDELGRPSPWVASYLSRLASYDFFIDNIDRSAQNFVAHIDGGFRKILAIDFASATLLMRPRIEVGLPLSVTMKFANLMKRFHGFDMDAALEMLQRIGSVPTSFMQSVMDKMPSGWLDEATAVRFLEFWGGNDRNERLARLKAGIINGSLY